MTDAQITFATSAEQKQQLQQVAENRDMSLSEYCRRALEQKVARDLQGEQFHQTELEAKLDELEDQVTTEIESALAPNVDEEVLYGVALWDLIGSEYSEESRADAMSGASDRLEQGLENLRQKERDDS